MTASINLEQVVQAYNAIRDARTVKRHAWEAEDLALEQDQETLKRHMLDLLNQVGGQSIATKQGTVYRTEKVKPSAADWAAIYEWIMQDPERFDLLEKRLKATFVKTLLDEGHALPPGVNVHREFEVSVRRPSGSGGTSA